MAWLLPAGTGGVAGAFDRARVPQGGSVAVRFIFGLSCLDPLRNGNALFVAQAAYESLLSADERGRIRPDLALRWKFGHGGKWLTLYLRHGVRFTNGRPFDARTVQQAFALFVKPPSVTSLSDTLRKVTILGRYTVRLEQTVPLRPVLDKLAGLPMIDPKSEIQAGADSCTHPPAGTGPFTLKSYTPGFSQITYVRNPRYRWEAPWQRNKGPAHLSSLVFKSIVSDVTGVNSLLSGDVDISRVPSTLLSQVSGRAGIKLHTFYENADLYLGFNAWRRPFESAAVRRAFAEAINRGTLLKVVSAGYGKVAYSPIPPTLPFYDKGAKRYAPRYDPGAARRTLAAHHVTGPFTLETYTIPAFSTSAEIIQSELAQVGVQVKLVTKDVPTVAADTAKGQFDLTVAIHRSNDLFFDYYSSPSPLNPVRNWLVKRNPALDSLIVKSRETINAHKAMAVYVRLQQYMDKHAIVDPLFSRQIILAARSRVKGWHMTGTADPLGYPVLQDLYAAK